MLSRSFIEIPLHSRDTASSKVDADGWTTAGRLENTMTTTRIVGGDRMNCISFSTVVSHLLCRQTDRQTHGETEWQTDSQTFVSLCVCLYAYTDIQMERGKW